MKEYFSSLQSYSLTVLQSYSLIMSLNLLPVFTLIAMPMCICGVVIKTINKNGNPIDPEMIEIRMKNHVQSATHRRFCEHRNIPLPPVEPLLYRGRRQRRDNVDAKESNDSTDEKISCGCGSNIANNQHSIRMHKRTKKHLKYEGNAPEGTQPPTLDPKEKLFQTIEQTLQSFDDLKKVKKYTNKFVVKGTDQDRNRLLEIFNAFAERTGVQAFMNRDCTRWIFKYQRKKYELLRMLTEAERKTADEFSEREKRRVQALKSEHVDNKQDDEPPERFDDSKNNEDIDLNVPALPRLIPRPISPLNNPHTYSLLRRRQSLPDQTT